MKIICAWCKKEMGEKEPLSDPRITHSICDDCHKDIKEQNKLYHLGRRMK